MSEPRRGWSAGDGVILRARLGLHRWVMPGVALTLMVAFTFSAVAGFPDRAEAVSTPILALVAGIASWKAWRSGVPSSSLERVLLFTGMMALVAAAVEPVLTGRFEIGYPFVVGYAPLIYTLAFLLLGPDGGWRASGVTYLGLAGATVAGVATDQIPAVRAVPLVALQPILIALLFGVVWSFSRASRDRVDAMAEAAVDPLTGALNRRSGERGLSMLDGPYGLLMIDLDGFKQLNDQRGHAFGDRVLTAVVRSVRIDLRPGDLVMRWGGDEFVVVAPGATLVATEALARRIETAVQAVSEALDVPLSVSIGVAVLEDDASWHSVFERADRSMYEVKRRNRG